MFFRSINKELDGWSKRSDRKPLMLRGARQVGKTTAVKIFSQKFKQFLYFNLDLPEDRKIFDKDQSFEELLKAVFFYKNASRSVKKTLIFIDEIQNSPQALKMLRYFYELAPELFVIAAGSTLETLLATDKNISIPVGRVEYLMMRPVSFTEFIYASNEKSSAEILADVPFPKYAHDKLLRLFNTYTLIGGMPEVVKKYTEIQDLTALSRIYDSILASYTNDIEKYAQREGIARVIRFIIQNAFKDAGNRIKMEGYGNSGYKYREVNEAFAVLEKALLLNRVWPTVETSIPIKTVHNKAPKLQLLDTGLVNHFSGLKQEVFGADDISTVYKGKIAEHIIGQELLTISSSVLYDLNFWLREKPQSSAEIDFVYEYKGLAIPVEVKSGATGKLRSLHLFMDMSKHPFAVRFYNNELLISEAKTIAGKKFHLLNLPYYLACNIEQYLNWFIKKY